MSDEKKTFLIHERVPVGFRDLKSAIIPASGKPEDRITWTKIIERGLKSYRLSPPKRKTNND